MTVRTLFAVFAATLLAASFPFAFALTAADWITSPSYYTHNNTGNRVQQHTPIGPFYTYPREDFVRSGYRQTRSSLQFGGSADHYHLVEEWGQPVRPYDEWRFPLRPYSAPYPEWGPPFAGLNFNNNYPFPYGFSGRPYGGNPNFPGNPNPNPNPPGGNPNPNPPGGNPNFPFPGGNPFFGNGPGFNPFFPGANQFQPFVPYRGYQPWFDDRYPAFDDRAPWRYQPFPIVP